MQLQEMIPDHKKRYLYLQGDMAVLHIALSNRPLSYSDIALWTCKCI